MNRNNTDQATPSQWLLNAIESWVKVNGGRLYAPVPHPAFSKIPVARGVGRLECLGRYINSDFETVLDIGMHFGSESHYFHDQGFQVTGIENDPLFAKIARELRDLQDKAITIYEGDFFDYPVKKFDIVLALNIFHHFIKTPDLFSKLDSYLDTLKCKTIFFQPSNPNEAQMINSYKLFQQNEFADYICHKLGLSQVTLIGVESDRNIYKID
jgi:16S rRNA A1518/A1519 N6-dimethyltransferase RsmA/KsgA/DIM1 with predicted DNA glycosylase/AP lyase activity